MDENINVGISVTSDQAEQGAAKAADSMTKAVAGIQQQLDTLVKTSQQGSAAIAQGFDRMSNAVNQSMSSVAASFRANAAIVDDYGNEVAGVSRKVVNANDEEARSHDKVKHSSVASRRELMVLAHELSMGNYKRFAGSLMVLGEQMDLMGKIMSPLGITIGITAGALAIAAHAAIEGAMQMQHLRNELILTGNYAGITAGQFMAMGDSIAANTGVKITAVRDALAAVASTGRFTGSALQPVAEAVSKIGQYSKASAEEVVKSFEKMDDGVYKWALNYDKQYHFATMAQLEHIRALEEQGEKEKAEAEAAQLVLVKINETAVQLGALPGLWHDIAGAASHAWDAMMNFGRPLTIDDQIRQLKNAAAGQGYEDFNTGDVNSGNDASASKTRLRQLEQQRDQKEAAAANTAAYEALQTKGSQATEELRSRWKALGGSVQLANEEIAKFRLRIDEAKAAAKASGDAVPPDVQDMIANQAKIEASIKKKYDRADTKKPKGQASLGQDYSAENAKTQAQLNLLKEQQKEETSELDKAYKARQVSLQAYYAQRLQIVLQGMDAEAAAIKQQLAQTQALEAKAATPSERIGMRTKEIELEGRLAVMAQQRAAAIAQSSQEMNAAVASESDALEKLAAKRTTEAAAQEQKRQVMIAQEQVKGGQMTQAQLIQMDAKFAQDETDVAVAALQKRLDTEKSMTLQAKQELQDQITSLIDQNQTKQLQFQLAAQQEQNQYAQAATNSIEGSFTKMFTQIESGTVNAKTIFLDFATSVEQAIDQMVAKQLTAQLFGASGPGSSGGMGGAGMLNSLLGMFGGAGGAGFDAAGSFGFSTAAAGSTDAVIGGLGASAGSEAAGGGMSALMGLAAFDVGSPYVPHDMVAQIHRGEAIVPAHLNSPYNPGGAMTVNNQFVLPNGIDMRTQSQIASMSGGAIQQAIRRNG